MKTKHKFPTKKQLEEGVDIACARSGDEALEDLEATHLRLQLATLVDEEGDEGACIVVLLRDGGKRRWVLGGVFPFEISTPWEEDDEILADYLIRLVEERGLAEEIDLDSYLEDDDDEDEDLDEDEDEDDDSAVLHINGKKEFDEVTGGGDLPVLVDFTAKWCGPCQSLAPHLAKLAEQHEGRLVVAKVDIDANEDVAELWKVEAVPTLLLFKGGKKVASMEGFGGLSQLKKFVAGHLRQK